MLQELAFINGALFLTCRCSLGESFVGLPGGLSDLPVAFIFNNAVFFSGAFNYCGGDFVRAGLHLVQDPVFFGLRLNKLLFSFFDPVIPGMHFCQKGFEKKLVKNEHEQAKIYNGPDNDRYVQAHVSDQILPISIRATSRP